MMSAPASRYSSVDRADDVGPRQDQDIVVAAQIARMIREPLAAEVGFGQLVALDHRAHRAVEDEDAAVESERRSRFAVRGSPFVVRCSRFVIRVVSQWSVIRGSASPIGAGFVPRRDEHGERIAGPARADADLDVGQPGVVEHRLSASSQKPSQRSPSVRAPTPRRARADRAPARGRPDEDARRLRERARRILRRGAAPATAARRRPARRRIGSFSSSPRFQVDVGDAAPRRERLARASSTSGDRSTAITREAQRRPRWSDSPRRSRGRRRPAAAAGGRARAPTRPSFGPAPAARSFVSGRRARRSSPSAAAALPAAAHRRRARRRSAAGAVELRPAAAATAARCPLRLVATGGAIAVVGEAALALLADQAGRP